MNSVEEILLPWENFNQLYDKKYSHIVKISTPENGDIVSGRKKLKTFANDVRTKTVQKQLAG